MTLSSVRRLSNDALRQALRELVAHDRITTVRLLIHIAELDSRRLYREDGYPGMKEYCMGELAMSEDITYKRIRVARRARRFPRIYREIADGSLSLSAVVTLSPYLTRQTADSLLTEARGKTRRQIELLLAERFPRPDLATLVQPLHAAAFEQRNITQTDSTLHPTCQELAPGPVERLETEKPAAWPEVKALSPGRFVVRFTISQRDHDLLEQAKALLAHRIPSGDEGEVFVQALRALVEQLEKRKYGATERPSRNARESKNPRYISGQVKRAVHDRDGGQCTFVAANGRRCGARQFLEFDHVLEVARGGQSTPENLRLRCRAHNRYTAERTFGTDLVQAKIQESQEAAARRRAEEVVPWLQALGIRGDHARQAAMQHDVAGASLEQRVTAALRSFGPRDVCLARAAPA